jgi:hypothetical protein
MLPAHTVRRCQRCLFWLIVASTAVAAEHLPGSAFPRPLAAYTSESPGLASTLRARIRDEPFNAVATGIFLLAIVHTFLTARFRRWAHLAEERHAAHLRSLAPADAPSSGESDDLPREVSFKGQILHFLGEVEAVFGLWAVVLALAIAAMKDWSTVRDYLAHTVNFTEAMFVVVIMAVASTRPVLRFAEKCLRAVAQLGGHSGNGGLLFCVSTGICGAGSQSQGNPCRGGAGRRGSGLDHDRAVGVVGLCMAM